MNSSASYEDDDASAAGCSVKTEGSMAEVSGLIDGSLRDTGQKLIVKVSSRRSTVQVVERVGRKSDGEAAGKSYGGATGKLKR